MPARKPRGTPTVGSQVTTDDSQSEMPRTSTPSKPKTKRQNHRGQAQSGSTQGGQPRGGQPVQSQDQTRNPVSPLTPPRHVNQMKPAGINVSPLNNTIQQSGKGKSMAEQGNGRFDLVSTTPGPRNSHSPNPKQQTPTVTPAKATQVYAGPTFHASPAPSSLPIPKFFSRSMPQVNNKDVSLQSMMQEDLSEESTSAGDESPTFRSSARVEQQKAREESPLDMFFRADREEKARRQNVASESSLSTPNANPRGKSASPGIGKSPGSNPPFLGADSRQSTEGSIFPLEMDGDALTKPDSHRTESSPSVLTTQDNDPAAQAKAKTEALKQLLMFPMSQRLASEAGLAQGQRQSQSPTPPRPTLSERSVSGGSISPFSAGSPHLGPGASFPYSPQYSPQHHHPQYRNTTSGSRRNQPRPTSSHLRQEVASESISELPSTPTPSRSQNMFNTNPSTSNANSSNGGSQRHASPRPPVKFGPQDALKASLGPKTPQTNRSTDLMEDELRRILKLDSILPSTGVR